MALIFLIKYDTLCFALQSFAGNFANINLVSQLDCTTRRQFISFNDVSTFKKFIFHIHLIYVHAYCFSFLGLM